MNIVIIDSGLDILDNNTFVDSVNGISIEKKDGNYIYSSDYKDTWGHGTIVSDILIKYLKTKSNLFFINIFKESTTIDVDLLIKALEYCLTIDCDLIQISLGTLISNNRLKQIIKKLYNKGVIIISAFDNDKSISYPAAYSEVIGVDVSSKYKKLELFDINDNNIVDIVGPDIYYRSVGSGGRKVIIKGSSFYTSYISAQIINFKPTNKTKCEIINEFKKVANQCNTCINQSPQTIFINHAIAFPFNKEIHSLAAFKHLLKFKLDGVYDIRQRGNVSRKIQDILPYTDNLDIVRDYNNINWDEPFDTFICGHMRELNTLLKKDILLDIIEKCRKYNKQLICFDNITNYPLNSLPLKYWFPHMSKSIIPQLRYGKLRTPNTPTIGVFGTSSNQGKMTLQLTLRDYISKQGIQVKNIGSEPQSILFGFEYSYVFGYQSLDDLTSDEMVLSLNEAIFDLEQDNCDMIIVGSQSGTIANQLKNINMIPFKQYSFLLGTQPDAIILCINSFDSIEYIMRTIRFIESAIKTKVLCIIVSSLNAKQFKIQGNPIEYYMNEINLPIFNLHDLDMDGLFKKIINYYEQ